MDNENKLNQSTENTSNLPKSIKNLQIMIGRTAKVTINSMEYDIEKELVKAGSELETKEICAILENMGLNYEFDEISSLYNQAMLDPTVINILNEINNRGCDVKDIVNIYIQDSMAADIGKDFKNRCNVVYDEKDICKVSIRETLKRGMNNLCHKIIFDEKEIDTYEKRKILYYARTANRFNLAKIEGRKHAKTQAIGEYKPSFWGKISEWITGERKWGNREYLLPGKKDMIKVAQFYDELKKEGKLSRINSEMWMDQYKYLTYEQKKELKELYESQFKNKNEKEKNEDTEKSKEQEWREQYVSAMRNLDDDKEEYVRKYTEEDKMFEKKIKNVSDQIKEKLEKEDSR